MSGSHGDVSMSGRKGLVCVGLAVKLLQSLPA